MADVCGLHVQAFRRIKEQLSRLFDVDDAGLWRDAELEAERERAVRRSATNRANGRKGGQARWPIDDPEGMGWASDGAADASDDMATGMAIASPVATSAEVTAPATASSAATVDPGSADAELHARIISACGDNITAELRQSRDVEPIRALLRDGFDLDREILPFLRDRVKALSTPLRSLRPGWIRKDLEKARASGALSKPAASAMPPTVFVPSGTPEWEACQAREAAEGRKPKVPIPDSRTGKNGSWFVVPLPPALRPAAAAE